MEEIKESKGKPLWAYGLTITYVSFMVLILTLVFKSQTHTLELVTDDYYEDGTNFQSTINRKKNTAALKFKPLLNQKTMSIDLQEEVKNHLKSGVVSFYKPDNSQLDFKHQINNPISRLIDLPDIVKGAWQIQLSWQDQDAKEYVIFWNIIR